MDRILNVKNISKSYKIGSKRTLLNIHGGLSVPNSGEVMLDGKNLYGLSEKERAKIRNQKCGFIYQNFNLINELSVINNIRLPFDIAGKPYNIKREKELLDILDLGKRRNFYPVQLSGGERQRTAVARALLMEPSIILADEPTGNLDLESGNKLMAFVKRTNREQGQTYVIVTHDLEWLKIAHTVYRMSDGRLEREVQK